MKAKKMFLSIFIVFFFFLNACLNNDVSEDLSSVQDASNRATQLENGRFSYVNVVENEHEGQTQETEGVFVVQDDYIDWHTELVLGEGNNNTLTETFQKEKTQYQRFGRINEGYQFIGNDNRVLTEEPEWQMVNEGATGYPDYLQSFMKIELNKDDIEKVEKIEGNHLTIYEITYNDSYLSSVKQNNIFEINEQLDKAKEEDADTNVISSLENSLSYNDNITYKSIKLILTVDDTGVLIGKELQSSFEQTVNDSSENIQMTDRIEILEYNGTDMKIEL
ncbi:hypothetical protein [Oceanobacillus rekensis]|uniref:hypothetical protein n=1 Tax=Oceanobacillus rekensis TaxID=937927 RepID=UPI000B43A9F4|nr:hypothetical protein [Oceanobacillus rekensis]